MKDLIQLDLSLQFCNTFQNEIFRKKNFFLVSTFWKSFLCLKILGIYCSRKNYFERIGSCREGKNLSIWHIIAEVLELRKVYGRT